jgi:ABC-type Mn2+/Zn2+ transport system permease subunit
VQRLHLRMAVGAVVGALSALTGLYLSYHANVATSAAVVLAATCFFLLAFLFSPRQGLLWPRRRRLSNAPEVG